MSKFVTRTAGRIGHIGRDSVKFQFDITIHEVSHLPPTASVINISWQRGAKNTATKESVVKNGTAPVEEKMSMVSTLYFAKTNKYAPKDYKFSVMETRRMKKIGKVHIDLGDFAIIPHGTTTQTFTLDADKLRSKPTMKMTIACRYLGDGGVGDAMSEISAMSLGGDEPNMSDGDNDDDGDVANIDDLDDDAPSPQQTAQQTPQPHTTTPPPPTSSPQQTAQQQPHQTAQQPPQHHHDVNTTTALSSATTSAAPPQQIAQEASGNSQDSAFATPDSIKGLTAADLQRQIRKLHLEIAQVKKERDQALKAEKAMRAERDKLQARAHTSERMEEELRQHEMELSRLRASQQTLQSSSHQANVEHEKLQETISDLRKQLNDVTAQLTQSNNTLAEKEKEFQGRLSEAEVRVREAEDVKKVLSKQCDEAKALLREEQAAKLELMKTGKQRYETAESELARVEASLTLQEKQNTTLSHEKTELQNQLEASQLQISTLQENLTSAQKSLEEGKSVAERREKALKEECDKLENRVEELIESVKKLMEGNETVEARLREQASLVSERDEKIQSLEQQVKNISTENANFAQQISTLESQLLETKNSAKTHKQQMEEEHAKEKTTTAEKIAKLEKDLRETREREKTERESREKEWNRRFVELQGEKDLLTSKLASQTALSERSEAEASALRLQLTSSSQDATVQLQQLLTDLADRSGQIKVLDSAKCELEREKQSLAVRLHVAEGEALAARSELEDILAAKDTLRFEMEQQLSEEQARHGQELRKLRDLLQQSQLDHNDATARIDELKQKVLAKDALLAELQSRVEVMTPRRSAAPSNGQGNSGNSELTEELAAAKKDVITAQQKLLSLQSELDAAQRKVRESERTIQNLHDDIEREKSTAETKTRQQDSRIEQLLQNVTKLQHELELARTSTANDGYKADLAQLRLENDNIREQLATTNSTNASLTIELQEMTNALHETETHLIDAQTKFQAEQAMSLANADQCAKLETELWNVQHELTNLRGRVSSIDDASLNNSTASGTTQPTVAQTTTAPHTTKKAETTPTKTNEKERTRVVGAEDSGIAADDLAVVEEDSSSDDDDDNKKDKNLKGGNEMELGGNENVAELRKQLRVVLLRNRILEDKLAQSTKKSQELSQGIKDMTENIRVMMMRKEEAMMKMMEQQMQPTGKGNKKVDSRVMILEEHIKQSNEEKALLKDTIRELGQHMCTIIEEKEMAVARAMEDKEALAMQLAHLRSDFCPTNEDESTTLHYIEEDLTTTQVALAKTENERDELKEEVEKLRSNLNKARMTISALGRKITNLEVEMVRIQPSPATPPPTTPTTPRGISLMSITRKTQPHQPETPHSHETTVSTPVEAVNHEPLQRNVAEDSTPAVATDEIALQLVTTRQQLVDAKVHLAEALAKNDQLKQDVKRLKLKLGES